MIIATVLSCSCICIRIRVRVVGVSSSTRCYGCSWWCSGTEKLLRMRRRLHTSIDFTTSASIIRGTGMGLIG